MIDQLYSHAHTETGFLPENFLPEFLDLVIWGHEHECLIDPIENPETHFHVCQPGSSVATSLMDGEAVPKHVGILTVTGKNFEMEKIRLKTVRPFVMRTVALADEPALKNIWKKSNNRAEITRHLEGIVNELIEEANQEWLDTQDEEDRERLAAKEIEAPRPLIRLRVEYTAPDGGSFDCENPQRFSKRFTAKVANDNDIIQFYRKKKTAGRKSKELVELPEESVLAEMALDAVKVEELVREFLTAQSLTILPQNSFGDSVSQFVDKDDRYAMEVFVDESLTLQVKHLLSAEQNDQDDVSEAMEEYRVKLESLFAAGQKPRVSKIGHVQSSKTDYLQHKNRKYKPKPDVWDDELDGAWEDQPGAIVHDDGEDVEMADEPSPPARGATARGRGRGRGRASKAATTSTRKTAAAPKAAPAKGKAGKRNFGEEEDDDEESDVNMHFDDDDNDDDDLFVKAASTSKKPTAPSRAAPMPSKNSTRSAATTKQSTLDFSQPSQLRARVPSSRAAAQKKQVIEVSDDDISDDEAFEPVPAAKATRSRR
jgi:double-strand break repair protein MRE11